MQTNFQATCYCWKITKPRVRWPRASLILGRLLHHFEPFFFFSSWKVSLRIFALPFSGITVKGKKKGKKSLYNCSENHKAPYKCKFITIKNLWHSSQGKSSHHSSFFFFFKGRNLYYPLALLGYSVVQPTFISSRKRPVRSFPCWKWNALPWGQSRSWRCTAY